MKKGLVLEGGAMRGLFTAGVLDVMMDHDMEFDGAVGVSAGACFGCNYKSKQPGRAVTYNKDYCRDPRYCSVRSWILTGDLFGAKFCYEDIPDRLNPFDVRTYAENPMDFYAVATDAQTGKAVYHNCLKGDTEDLRWFRASASMPIASRAVEIDGKKYLDGGVADSVPLKFFQEIGYDRNVVVLTQPEGYVKSPQKFPGLFRLVLSKYPAIAEGLIHRHISYSQTIEYIRKEEEKGTAFVIRPKESLGIGHVCHDPQELERVYQTGRRRCEELLSDLEAFLAE